MIEINNRNFDNFCDEIIRLAKYRNKCIFENEDIMFEHSDTSLKAMLNAYDIIFNTKHGLDIIKQSYISRIYLGRNGKDSIKLEIITKEESDQMLDLTKRSLI